MNYQTELFRERCNDQNLLSFEAMLGISEISGMITDGEVTVDELRTMWAGLPSQGGLGAWIEGCASR